MSFMPILLKGKDIIRGFIICICGPIKATFKCVGTEIDVMAGTDKIFASRISKAFKLTLNSSKQRYLRHEETVTTQS
jgi:hypothetical protein